MTDGKISRLHSGPLASFHSCSGIINETMHSCCAYGCKSKFVKGSPVTFHSFPKDPVRRRLWEIQLKRKDFKASQSAKICSRHFTPDCFDTRKFGGTWLKTNAVPTIFNFPEYMKNIQKEFPVKREPESVESDEEVPCSFDIERMKREHYFGDFNEDDMESPTKAKQAFSAAQSQIFKLQKTVKSLRQQNKRLKRKVASIQETGKKKYVTDTAMTNMNETGKSNILEFLMLVGKLKHLKRTGWVKRNIPECESVAGHMYRMGVMAFFLDGNGFLGLDRNRCIKMALIHDIAECIVGDITPFCGVSKEEKHRREVEAMERLCSLVGKKIGEEIFSLFMEYEKQETPEAKAVKDLDKFDMILQAFEYEVEMKQPNFLQGFFDNTGGTFTNPLISKWAQDLKSHREQNKPEMEVKVENV